MLLVPPGDATFVIPRSDRRYLHILSILGKHAGDILRAGSPDGTCGYATITGIEAAGIHLAYTPEIEAPPLHPVRILLGFPRPIQAARIFKDLASLGVAEIMLTGSDLGEKSYIRSSFFVQEAYRDALGEGAEQAGSPRLPVVTRDWTLDRCLLRLGDRDRPGSGEGTAGPQDMRRLVLHPGSCAPLLGVACRGSTAVTLAIGSERGWSEREVGALESSGFRRATLGDRILKTETATLAATILALSALGCL